MAYDFETLRKRTGTGSDKWDLMLRQNPGVGKDVVPFSIADMELLNPPELTEGLKDFLDHTILGYTQATDGYYEAVQDWMESRHGFRPEKEWFVETAGVVPAIYQMVRAYTQPGDGVLLCTPAYYPFYMAIEAGGCTAVCSELKICGKTYEIDFDDFAEKAARPEVKLFILCSPHNPVGRVFTKEELVRLSEICLRNGVFMLADEIHFDLILPGYKHVSVGTLERKYVENSAICTAPSKTFNLAGLQTSNIFIADRARREKITSARGYFSLNVFGYRACELAYRRCGGWLEDLLLHLDGNKKLLEQFFAEYFPEVAVFELQGTYLMWLDFCAWGMSTEELDRFMKFDAQLFLDEGDLFGEGGKGFERWNIACPRWVLEQALERLRAARAKKLSQ